jgi:hypothetical protein
LANFLIYLAIGHTVNTCRKNTLPRFTRGVETKKNITFKTGMPDDYLNKEDCVHMWLGIGQWNDIPCENTYETMCEAVFNCS